MASSSSGVTGRPSSAVRGSGASGPGAAGPPSVGSSEGRYSPEGVQMLLTLVSSREIDWKRGLRVPTRPARCHAHCDLSPSPGPFRAARPRVSRRRASRVRRRFASAPTTRGDATLAADDTRINDRIRARQVLLIGGDGTQYGVKPLPEALSMAREQGFDLVEVAANADPPVCRIMDFGKWKYEQDQRRKESRKRATNVVIKEMKFRPKIDGHDFETKMKHVERFLGEGSKVKLTIMFRGREMAHPEIGRKILEQGRGAGDRVRHGRVGAPPGRPQHDDGAESPAQAGCPTRQAQGPGACTSTTSPGSGAGGDRARPGTGVPAGTGTPDRDGARVTEAGLANERPERSPCRR